MINLEKNKVLDKSLKSLHKYLYAYYIKLFPLSLGCQYRMNQSSYHAGEKRLEITSTKPKNFCQAYMDLEKEESQ